MKTTYTKLALAAASLGLAFAPFASAYTGGVLGDAQWGTFTETVSLGHSVSIGLEPTASAAWSIVGNSNPNVASAVISGNNIIMTGNQPGFSTAKACAGGSNCINVSINVVTSTQTSGNVLGANTFNNGQLVVSNKTIYAIYKNTKAGFTSLAALKALGYTASSAVSADASALPDSGYLISTSASAHPLGSWITSGKTVYFVHELGLIPVSSWDVFLSNGGSASLLVKANKYDLALPMLSEMIANDSRLK